MSGEGDSHRETRSAEAKAPKMRSGDAPRRRVTSARVSGVATSAPLAQELFQLIYSPLPERLVSSQPASRFAQALRLQPEPMYAAVHGPFDELRVLEHPQVFGYRRLRRPEVLSQLSRRAWLAAGELVQDSPSCAIAERMERAVQLFSLKHSQITI